MSYDGIDLVIKQSNCDCVLVFLIKSLKKKMPVNHYQEEEACGPQLLPAGHNLEASIPDKSPYKLSDEV